MAVGTDQYEIMGISLFGPPPLKQIHLPFDTGLFTFFGPNGAGKSSILEGILGALQGRKRARVEAYIHVRLTGLTRDSDPDQASRFELSLRRGLNMDPEQVYGRTRQWLWNGVIESISDRAELAIKALGDNMVVSLRSTGTEDTPKWDAFYSMQLDDEDWSRLEAHQRWSSSIIDRVAGRHESNEKDARVDLVDEIHNAPPLPFHVDSPMWSSLPLVQTAGVGDNVNFWPPNWPLP